MSSNWKNPGYWYRQKKQNEKAKQEELAQYHIKWECKHISERTNTILNYVAWVLIIIPIIVLAVYWEALIQMDTTDWGLFLQGYGLFWILVPVIIIGIGLLIAWAVIRSSCRKKYQK